MKDTNKIDTITVDVPLFIRLLEYAREDAKTDMDLHDVAENATAMSSSGKTLCMKDYKSLVKINKKIVKENIIKPQFITEIKRMQLLAGLV